MNGAIAWVDGLVALILLPLCITILILIFYRDDQKQGLEK